MPAVVCRGTSCCSSSCPPPSDGQHVAIASRGWPQQSTRLLLPFCCHAMQRGAAEVVGLELAPSAVQTASAYVAEQLAGSDKVRAGVPTESGRGGALIPFWPIKKQGDGCPYSAWVCPADPAAPATDPGWSKTLPVPLALLPAQEGAASVVQGNFFDWQGPAGGFDLAYDCEEGA